MYLNAGWVLACFVGFTLFANTYQESEPFGRMHAILVVNMHE